ncbi:hypothetical protein LNKW23_23110 [Paralimibaculum aggregatum]|uniref:Uncharacterized protein n=1 Tax=Paralimibaculum aggregatum TaxID=3036245 RepID=A0ABQ6LP97_9RHOB|nr:hypothetical protein [Limibaculum sp. NKW23]GMG83098.1 hypothetical protein LNKW23_23110 [Limibaculum sp. NKW23]
MTGRQAPHLLTLGPEGTNHALVARRYLAFHGAGRARLGLVDDFFAALARIAAGEADLLLMAAVHADCAAVVAEAHFSHGIHVVDTFISSSRALAILTRAGIARPRSIALQPATRGYADLSAWAEQIEAPSTMAVAEGLLAGRFESGLTVRDLADAHPGRFRVDREIGSVDDPWILLGRARVAGQGLVAWPDGPGARLLRGEG